MYFLHQLLTFLIGAMTSLFSAKVRIVLVILYTEFVLFVPSLVYTCQWFDEGGALLGRGDIKYIFTPFSNISIRI